MLDTSDDPSLPMAAVQCGWSRVLVHHRYSAETCLHEVRAIRAGQFDTRRESYG
jgi:hypothetical protein